MVWDQSKLASQHAWLSALPQVRGQLVVFWFTKVSFVGDGDVDCTLFENFGFGDCVILQNPLLFEKTKYKKESSIYSPWRPSTVLLVVPVLKVQCIRLPKRKRVLQWWGYVATSLYGTSNHGSCWKLAAHTVERIELHAKRAQDFETQGLWRALMFDKLKLDYKTHKMQ